MDLVLAATLLALVFAVLAYPLYTARPRTPAPSANALGDLQAQRDGVYATLRDLDQDYQLGKLDAADYTARRDKYMARAAALLRQLDALGNENGGPRDQDAELEREIAALRRHKADATAAPTPNRVCAKCGRAYNEGDRFCAKCGQSLPD